MKQQSSDSKRPRGAAGPSTHGANRRCSQCNRPTPGAFPNVCDDCTQQAAAEAELQQTAQQDTPAGTTAPPRANPDGSRTLYPLCRYCNRPNLQHTDECDECQQYTRHSDGSINRDVHPFPRQHDHGCDGGETCQRWLPCDCWCHEPELGEL